MNSLVVSVVIPVHNGEAWLVECLQSVLDQQCDCSIQVSVYNDCSSDSTQEILDKFKPKFEVKGINTRYGGHTVGGPKGVGYAKNRAVEQSDGQFLCFLDADDVMHPERIDKQLEYAMSHPDELVGCCVERIPEGATERYTRWANTLTQEQLYLQAYTSHGPTILMPTWFCARQVYDNVGGFVETGKGTPEDLIFFYKHLSLGGKLYRVDQNLLAYRYHPQAETFSVKEETIWELRVEAIQTDVLCKWDKFTIWNAGKQGRKLYRSLSEENQAKVQAFCDVDEKKVSKGFYTFEESEIYPRPKIPIVHFRSARPPFLICVKLDLTGGAFEDNLASLNLTEGKDYTHFN